MIICANCGAQLKDDQLLCEVCGAEVSLVPEFEPLIEDRITQSLSGITYEDEFIPYEDDGLNEIPLEEGEFEEYDPSLLDGNFEEYIPEEEAKVELKKNEKALADAFRVSVPVRKDSKKVTIHNTDSLLNFLDLDADDKDNVPVQKVDIRKKEKTVVSKNENIIEKKEISDAKAVSQKLKKDVNSSVEAKTQRTHKRDAINDSDVKKVHVTNKEYVIEESVDDEDNSPQIKDIVENRKKNNVSSKAGKHHSKKKKQNAFLSFFMSRRNEEDAEFDPDDDFGDFDDDIHFFRFIFEFIRDSKFRWVAIVLIVAVIVFLVIGIRKITGSVVEKSSATHQAELARAEASNGNYEGAIEYMDKAINLSPEDDGLRFELANYYFVLEDDESALIELKIIVGKKGAGYTTAYQMLVDYYAGKSDYASINTMLSSCTDDTILAMYNDYLANEPVFAQAEGTYEDSIMVEILPPGNGVVYYTTDGSNPTTSSDIYYSPFYLDLGIYHIKAMYVNPYGIESKVVAKAYTVDIRTPDAPEVLTVSGTYTYPRLIEVDVQKGCDLFYTTDNTLPTRMSNKYEGPIAMPVGESHFLFVAYTAEGVPGDITDVRYNLAIDSELNLEQVVTNLYVYDYLSGKAFDIFGHLPGNSTHFDYRFEWACTYGVDFPAWDDPEAILPDVKSDQIFYVVVERLVDSMGKESKTGNVFLVNAGKGDIYIAGKNAETGTFLDENGKLVFNQLIPPENYTIPPELLMPTEEVPQEE